MKVQSNWMDYSVGVRAVGSWIVILVRTPLIMLLLGAVLQAYGIDGPAWTTTTMAVVAVHATFDGIGVFAILTDVKGKR